MPPITFAQRTEREDADEVLALRIGMPFFEGFEVFFGQRYGIIHAHIGLQVKVFWQFQRGVVVFFLVFVTLLVPEGGDIAQYSRAGREATRTFSVEELAVGEAALYDHTIIFVTDESELIVLCNELRHHEGGNLPVLQLLCLGDEAYREPLFSANRRVRELDMIDPIPKDRLWMGDDAIGMGKQQRPLIDGIPALYIE